MDPTPFNPYQAPTSALEVDHQDQLELAGRAVRLGAMLLDTVLRLILIMPLMWGFGYIERSMAEQVSVPEDVGWTILAVSLFLAAQAYPLHHFGQTWGKRIVGIRIANLDGSKPGFWTLIGTRYGIFEFGFLVPIAGNVLALIDTVMIFRRDRRCLHDLAAGTIVVKVQPTPPEVA